MPAGQRVAQPFHKQPSTPSAVISRRLLVGQVVVVVVVLVPGAVVDVDVDVVVCGAAVATGGACTAPSMMSCSRCFVMTLASSSRFATFMNDLQALLQWPFAMACERKHSPPCVPSLFMTNVPAAQPDRAWHSFSHWSTSPS